MNKPHSKNLKIQIKLEHLSASEVEISGSVHEENASLRKTLFQKTN